MTSVSTDRRYGVNSSMAIKVPCRAATIGNITLHGLQTIDGIVLAAGDRVLVKAQTTGTQNGIWTADTGDWARAIDCDGNYDLTQGSMVMVIEGSAAANTLWRVTTSNPITVGSSSIAFAPVAIMLDTSQQIPSVRTFGAVGDSTNGVDGTDDTAAIQAAVTSGNCYFPDTGKKYRVTGNIVVPSNRLIKGPGTISVGNAAGYVPAFSLDGVDNVTFDGLNFHANQTTSNAQCAVDMTNTVLASPCTNITVRNAVCTNIGVITSYRTQGNHNTGAGTYVYSNYANAAYRHGRISVEHVRCVATDVTGGTNLSKQTTELGYMVYLFFADDVRIHDLQTTNQAWGVFLWAGTWSDTHYLATYQYSERTNLTQCVFNNCRNAIISLTQKDCVFSDSVIYTPGGETVDVENGRNILFDSIICRSDAAGCFLWQGTNNDIVFNNCQAYASQNVATAGRSIVGGGGDKATQYDLEHTGIISWIGGIIHSSVIDQYVVCGAQNGFRMIGTDLLNCTMQVNGPVNTFTLKDCTFSFVSAPAHQVIELNGLCSLNALGNAAGITYNAAMITNEPRATITGNVVKAFNATNRVDATMVGVNNVFDDSYITVMNNEFCQGNANKVAISAGAAALTKTRSVVVQNNIIPAGGGLGSPLYAALDGGTVKKLVLGWKNNSGQYGLDSFGSAANCVGATNIDGVATDGCLAGSSYVIYYGGGTGKIWDQTGAAWVGW